MHGQQAELALSSTGELPKGAVRVQEKHRATDAAIPINGHEQFAGGAEDLATLEGKRALGGSVAFTDVYTMKDLNGPDPVLFSRDLSNDPSHAHY